MISSVRSLINVSLDRQIKEINAQLGIVSGRGFARVRDLVCWERYSVDVSAYSNTRKRLFESKIEAPETTTLGRVPFAKCELPSDRAWLIDGFWVVPDADGTVADLQDLLDLAAMNIKTKGGDEVALPYIPLARLFAGSPLDWSQTTAADGFTVAGRPGDYYPFQVPILVPPNGIADVGYKFGTISGISGDVALIHGLHGLEFSKG